MFVESRQHVRFVGARPFEYVSNSGIAVGNQQLVMPAVYNCEALALDPAK